MRKLLAVATATVVTGRCSPWLTAPPRASSGQAARRLGRHGQPARARRPRHREVHRLFGKQGGAGHALRSQRPAADVHPASPQRVEPLSGQSSGPADPRAPAPLLRGLPRSGHGPLGHAPGGRSRVRRASAGSSEAPPSSGSARIASARRLRRRPSSRGPPRTPSAGATPVPGWGSRPARSPFSSTATVPSGSTTRSTTGCSCGRPAQPDAVPRIVPLPYGSGSSDITFGPGGSLYVTRVAGTGWTRTSSWTASTSPATRSGRAPSAATTRRTRGRSSSA